MSDYENDLFNFIPMNRAAAEQNNDKQLNLEGPSSKQLKKSSTAAFTSVKKLTRGAKIIRIEIYDTENFPDHISSLCNCDAELCVQHVVKNVFMDDVYKSVKEIALKVSDIMP
ncbi:uncharacterized protein LOC124644834 [Helicoverpa zea]|uniref:uncharacterized protein LOC124634478 n=1 Tax=Helicoverpa zea TaxID=7113 RepID=UPI000DAB2053|nr:uncharacterized protein LOC124634478 [Helicoverpa zea]XP_047036093.1 uncharacterized protein LOC124641885 [Helicoverpa zea]XP_047039185.1 uncharacterized protein LOC124644044 [Helicoverpa zea]XP_047039236.1 uncharacterized protein LOC124644074 [Helicoverpa zea]XP_047039899.1 uncharacterized protein LOC124644514 [Helicoverpa zea]XP_047040395.1 uncharacterized protein LOC124644834 [Helicoverpa zea]PZC85652.1 hypothetical protein B5X24_HaOG215922 [Helicoverpa armigera]